MPGYLGQSVGIYSNFVIKIHQPMKWYMTVKHYNMDMEYSLNLNHELEDDLEGYGEVEEVLGQEAEVEQEVMGQEAQEEQGGVGQEGGEE